MQPQQAVMLLPVMVLLQLMLHVCAALGCRLLAATPASTACGNGGIQQSRTAA